MAEPNNELPITRHTARHRRGEERRNHEAMGFVDGRNTGAAQLAQISKGEAQ
jgi:hypothetical protein